MSKHPTIVRRWLELAGVDVKDFSQWTLVVADPAEAQLAQSRVGGIQASESIWVWSAIEDPSRTWIATRVSRRMLRASRQFLAEVSDSWANMVIATLLRGDGAAS